MTAVLILLAVVVVAELVSGVRMLRSDRPVSPPRSHPDWSWDRLPSRPYSVAR